MFDETLAIAIAAFAVLVPGLMPKLLSRLQSEKIENDIEQAAERAVKEPEKSKPTWDLANARLALHFERNNLHVQAIFWLSITVMIIGFAIIIWGIGTVFQYDAKIEIATIATIAGIVTEFIGATFLFMYKSILQESSHHFKTLEYMNSIGIAMQILDTMPDDMEQVSLKEKTKAEIATGLVMQSTKRIADIGEKED